MSGAFFLLSFLLPSASAQAPAGHMKELELTDAARAMNIVAAQYLEKVSQVQNLTDPAKCGASNPAPPKEPEMKIYQCTLEQEPDSGKQAAVPALPKKESRFRPGAKSVFVFSENNDDLFLGLINSAGNDMGYTHGFNAAYLKTLDQKNVIGFEVGSNLYTRHVADGQARERAAYYQENGFAPSGNVYLGVDHVGTVPIHFIDNTSLKATFEHGTSFYYRVAASVEFRQDDPSKFALAKSTQKGWHHFLNDKLHTAYQFDYYSPDGRKSKVLNDTPKSGDIMITDGWDEATDIKNTAKVSIGAGADVGKRFQVFGGKCELQIEAGGFVSTEGKQVVGPNSFIHVSSDLKGTVLKSKKKVRDLNLDVGTTILYFPTAGIVDQNHLGFSQRAELESDLKLGKKNNRVSPFIAIYTNGGRLFFDNVNDHDPIMTLGIRLKFNKTKN